MVDISSKLPSCKWHPSMLACRSDKWSCAHLHVPIYYPQGNISYPPTWLPSQKGWEPLTYGTSGIKNAGLSCNSRLVSTAYKDKCWIHDTYIHIIIVLSDNNCLLQFFFLQCVVDFCLVQTMATLLLLVMMAQAIILITWTVNGSSKIHSHPPQLYTFL